MIKLVVPVAIGSRRYIQYHAAFIKQYTPDYTPKDQIAVECDGAIYNGGLIQEILYKGGTAEVHMVFTLCEEEPQTKYKQPLLGKVHTVLPPTRALKYKQHWLYSESCTYPSIYEYVNGKWFGTGEVASITGEELYQRGWRYYGPVIPPEELVVFFPDEDD